MKLFIESCLDDLFIALIDNSQTIDFIHEKNMIKKSDNIAELTKELLTRNNLNFSDVDIYVTNGPGSFMGIRAGLIFSSTLCQMNDTKLFVADTLDFVSQGKEGNFFISAKSGKSYTKDLSGKVIIVKEQNPTTPDYEVFIKDPMKTLCLFKEIKPSEVFFNYVKEPRIG